MILQKLFTIFANDFTSCQTKQKIRSITGK